MGANRDNEPLTDAEAIGLARRYVAAYNDRDLEAMLALQHEDVVSYPSRLFGPRRLNGRAGVRAWWDAMAASGEWYEVVIANVRLCDSDRVAILGEICHRGKPLSPWAVIVRIRGGLIVESHSYLSPEEPLEHLGLLGAPSVPT